MAVIWKMFGYFVPFILLLKCVTEVSPKDTNTTTPDTPRPITSSQNTSGLSLSFHDQVIGYQISIYATIVIGSIAFLLNSVLVLVFIVDPLKCLRNVSSYLILNITVADQMTAVCIVFWTSNAFQWYDNAHGMYVSAIIWVGYLVSFLTIALLSCERYIAIRYIWSANRIVTKRRTLIAIAVIWLCSSTAFLYSRKEYQPMFQIVLSSIIEVCVIAAVVFYYKLWSYRRKLMEQVVIAIHEETQLTVAVFLLSIALVITTLPLVASYQLIFLKGEMCGHACISEALYFLPNQLLPVYTLNFGINPIVYAWRLPKYRQSLTTLCSIVWHNGFRCGEELRAHKRTVNRHSAVIMTQITTSVSHDSIA